MSEFGDFEPDDAADTAHPDGEALARLFVIERRRATGDSNQPAVLEDVPRLERIMLLFVFAAIAARLRDERP